MRAVVKVSLTKQASDTLNNLRDSKFDKWYKSCKKKKDCAIQDGNKPELK